MANNLTNNVISCINLLGTHYQLKTVPFHATEAEWLISNYIPKQGEIIVYDADASTTYPRYKTGDGVTKANKLSFSLVTQEELRAQINSAGHLRRQIVESLPTVGEPDIIYMVKTGLVTNDNYDEWMYIDNAWELIGNTRIDLSDYAKKDEIGKGNFTVSGTGALSGSGTMNANQSSDSTAVLDIVEKGITTAKIADGAIGAEQTKASTDYAESDAEVWVFYCGTATELV